jgi:ribosomal protein S18 acetylase RimI-like enzyme
VRIAPLTETDAEAFHAVVDGVARERLYLAMLQAYPLDDVRKYVRECIEKRRPMFGAFTATSLIGWCDVVEKPRETLAHSGVLGMGVAKEHRGRGVGRALMEATLADARSKGFKRIELSVRVDNERAKGLYEKFGFVTEGRMRRHTLVDGAYQDSWLMSVLYD